MGVWEKVFGEELVTQTGKRATGEALDGKHVLVYFSASWCGPCQQFTPVLKETYKTLLKAKKKVEVVFVSSDKSADSAASYFQGHHGDWYMMPYAERKRKDKLSRKYGVQGIPTLVVLDDEGKLITGSGRMAVMTDKDGSNFPWKPKPLLELMGPKLVNAAGETFTPEQALKGKVYGILFSAPSWCPPCRALDPILEAKYKQLGGKLEVVFVTSDKTKDAFDTNRKKAPWPSVPWEADDARMELAMRFGVRGIPHLVIVDKDGSIITEKGVSAIRNGEEFPFKPAPPKPVNEFGAQNVDQLQENMTIVAFVKDAEKDKFIEAIKPAADKLYKRKFGHAEKKEDDDDDDAPNEPDEDADDLPLVGFVSDKAMFSDRLRGLIKARGINDEVVLLNLAGGSVFHLDIASVKDFTSAKLEQVLADLAADKLKEIRLG